jgi:hypothetical protein
MSDVKKVQIANELKAKNLKLKKAKELKAKNSKLLLEQKNVLEATKDLSLESILDKLNKIDTTSIKVKEKKNSDKRSNTDFYKYEFLFKSIYELDFNLIDKDTFKIKGQRIRTKVRNKRNSFANNIILYKNNSDIENLKKEVKSFISFYLETYVLNDYSLKSISSNNRDKETTFLLSSMLDIIKLIK